MNALKNNSELNNHLKQLLKGQHKLRFGGLFGLSQKTLADVQSLELNNIPSGNGLESLPNLKELKLIINKPDIDMDSYISSIDKLPNLNKLDLNIPKARYLSKEQIKALANIENVDPEFHISSDSYKGYKPYCSDDMLQLNEKLDDFKKLVNPLMSEEEKVQRIYHELGNYMHFEEDRSAKFRDKIGSIINGQGNCQGYSKVLETILNDNGMECITVGGQAGKPGDLGHHAWNQVKVNGNWYNLDLTFDSASDKEGFNKGNWHHFLKSDAEFGKSHIRDPDEGHPCTDASFDNKEIKINHKPFFRDRTHENVKEQTNNNSQEEIIGSTENKELTPLQQHFAEVEAKTAENPQQNFKPGFSLNNLSQDIVK